MDCIRSSRAVLCFALALAIGLALPAYGRTSRSKKATAETRFDAAQQMRDALAGRAESERTRRDYMKVISAFQHVYLDAPTSARATDAIVASAELFAEGGRVFDDPQYFRRAIQQYEFLQKEYPGSRYRFEALFTIGQIYLGDLDDAAKAKATFQEFLKKYPGNRLAVDARKAIAEIDGPKPAKSAKKPEPKPAPQPKADVKEQAAEQSAPHNGALPLVTRVRHWSTPDYTRVVIDIDSQVKYEAGRVDNPDRIFFDLHDTKLASELIGKTFEVEDGFLKKIRVAPFQRGLTRVVLEVQDVADYSAFFLPNPYRLVIDIHGRQPSQATLKALQPPAKPAPKAVEKPVETARETKPEMKPAEPPKPEPAKAAAEPKPKPDDKSDEDLKNASKATPNPTTGPTYQAVAPREAKPHEARPTAGGDRSLIRALGLKIGKIVVDAGHGGHDTGTIGPTGYTEKELVLDVALRLGKLLEDKLGADVVYTRDDDTFVPLETRTAIANQEQADLFISIHANSSRDPSARGVETYYLNFTSSADALEVAARENAVSEKSIHELQDLVKKIALKEKIEESHEFASDVQTALWRGVNSKSAPVRNRGVKKAPFVVLIGANMPSILAEISFVSNPNDEKNLRKPEYRQKIAEALFKGIQKYVGGLSGVKVATHESPKASGGQ